METDILISNIEKFLSEYYGEICTSKSKNISYLDIDFKDLIQYDPDFADMLIDDFENVEQTFGIVLTDLFEAKKVKPRFKNITNAIKKDIWKIRSKDVDKLIVIEGYIRRIAPIQHEIISARFECPSCGNITTIFMQEGIFKKPTVCSCGRKGKFNLVSKEIRDVRKLVVEDDPLLVKPPQKPGAILVNLSEDLCREGIDKFLQPSKKVKIIGLLKDRQVKPYLTICKKYIEANSIEILDETIEKIKFSKKDVEEFESIAKKKNLYKDLAQSIIPNIEGHVTVKTAILLQLMGGVSLFMDDRLEERGLIHILLVGSPGCLCGNTYITLSDGTFKKIKSFGNVHLEQINNYLRIDKRGPAESPIAKAEVFHKYLNQKTIKITTQTGKEIICNYNHPFWVKRNEVSSTRNKKCWIKAEDLRLNDSIKVMRKIQCTKKRYEQLNPDFSNVARQAKEIKIPFCNEDVAFLWGYIIGDGCVHKGYELIIYINENEQELIPRITKLINTNFGIKERIKKIKKGDGIIGNRIIHRSEPIYEIHYDSKKLAIIFAMPKQPYRTIPEIIMASKKSVVAYFLRGLFDADGCCTISYKNREHRAPCPKIQLKSSSHQLLLDTQLLLIKFGIQARINQDNLIIARSDDIIIYNKEIGFTVKKKKAKLQEAIKIANRNRKNRKLLLYEKIIKLDENEKQTVYDIEVPKVHRFISNGLISHNTGKSVMLKRATEFLPRSRFTGGRGISGVGLIGAVIKDEEMGGYILDIGAVPLSSNSMIAIDECFPADTEILTEK